MSERAQGHAPDCNCHVCEPYTEWLGDARLASEDARELMRDDALFLVCSDCGRKSWAADDTRECGMPQPDGTRCRGTFVLPSPSGPDAETLAATVRRGISATRVPRDSAVGQRLAAAEAALSGLVALVEQLTEQSTERLWRLNNAEALVEQRERERDDQRTRRYELAADATRKCTEFRERAEKAEALLARHRQALEDTGRIAISVGLGAPTRYIEIAKIARDALAASAPGTKEPA